MFRPAIKHDLFALGRPEGKVDDQLLQLHHLIDSIGSGTSVYVIENGSWQLSAVMIEIMFPKSSIISLSAWPQISSIMCSYFSPRLAEESGAVRGKKTMPIYRPSISHSRHVMFLQNLRSQRRRRIGKSTNHHKHESCLIYFRGFIDMRRVGGIV